MNSIQRALIKKDVKEITSSKQIFIPMIIVPLVFTLIVPIILFLAVYFSPDETKMINDMKSIVEKLPSDLKNLQPKKLMITVAINYAFPSLFLLIPLMASSVIGASSFVGEKEHKTLETLLYTPISTEELFSAKIVGVFIPSYIVTLISFVIFGIVINIGGFRYFGELIFPNIKWLMLIFYISPGVTMLGLTFTVLVSAKSNNFQESQQISGLIVLPFIFLMVGQLSGLFLLTDLSLVIIGTVIFIIDYIIIKIISRRFVPEKLI